MQAIWEQRFGAVKTLSDIADAMQEAILAHSDDLNIGHDRMVSDFHCLWMLLRIRITVDRLPIRALRVRTWLRRPGPAVSVRDFALYDGDEEVGSALQYWALVDTRVRRLLPMKAAPVLWTLPTPEPERTEAMRALRIPSDLTPTGSDTVTHGQIDRNGHRNHVDYIRSAEAVLPGRRRLELCYEHECFEGETLTLLRSGDIVQGVKPDGTESFRARLWEELS